MVVTLTMTTTNTGLGIFRHTKAVGGLLMQGAWLAYSIVWRVAALHLRVRTSRNLEKTDRQYML